VSFFTLMIGGFIMNLMSRFSAAAVGFTLFAGTVTTTSASDSMMMKPAGAPMLTNAKSLRAAKSMSPLNGAVSGQLEQTNSCNTVALQRAGGPDTEPTFRAVQVPVKKTPCLQVVTWVTASAKLPAADAHYVNVVAKGGKTRVKIQYI
jgi:hypothetical protein